MPQMSPIWWLTLMLMFNLCFFFMNSMLYFNYKIKSTSLDYKNKFKMNWEW
uniref:ATP synthase complex subunit 8 n=1 Tax=Idioscopus clypealis TaxID=925781 RepID=A0A346RNK2_9HEMI|nr:ATP synthase F0 subunit 8 [Idioscopus clypealis]AXS67649.1 ATP synthase F0 subunit 8 [Idioscopus clypealis]